MFKYVLSFNVDQCRRWMRTVCVMFACQLALFTQHTNETDIWFVMLIWKTFLNIWSANEAENCKQNNMSCPAWVLMCVSQLVCVSCKMNKMLRA